MTVVTFQLQLHLNERGKDMAASSAKLGYINRLKIRNRSNMSVALIGEAPAAEEMALSSELDAPIFVGTSGMLIDGMCSRYGGFDMRTDCFVMNACEEPLETNGDGDPIRSKAEIGAKLDKKFKDKLSRLQDGAVVFLLGEGAMKAFEIAFGIIFERCKENEVTKRSTIENVREYIKLKGKAIRGSEIKFLEFEVERGETKLKIYVGVGYHPSKMNPEKFSALRDDLVGLGKIIRHCNSEASDSDC